MTAIEVTPTTRHVLGEGHLARMRRSASVNAAPSAGPRAWRHATWPSGRTSTAPPASSP